MFAMGAFIGNLEHINSMGKSFLFEVFVTMPPIEKYYVSSIMGDF